MKKIRVFSIFLLAICLSFVFVSCKNSKEYDISEVKSAKNVVVNKKEAKLSFTVSSGIDKFDPSNIVISTGKVKVYKDEKCTQDAETPLNLVEGTNKFYFKIVLNKNNKVLNEPIWELTINRQPSTGAKTYELYSFEKTYNVGDAFKGGKIKETVNGEVAYITITENMLTGFTTENEGEYEVTIKYEDEEFKVTITVYPNGQSIIPNYPEITPSTLKFDDVKLAIAKMIARIENSKATEEEIEKLALKVLEDDDNAEYCITFGRAIIDAGLTQDQVDKVIAHVLKCFEGYSNDNDDGIGGVIAIIIDTFKRVISIFDGIETIVSEVQIGQIFFTAYKSAKLSYLGIEDIINALSNNPDYAQMMKTLKAGEQILVSRNELMFLGIAASKELKEISKAINEDLEVIMHLVEIISSYMSSETLGWSENTVKDLNKVGEILDGIFQKIGANTLNACVDVAINLFSKSYDDIEDYQNTLEICELIRNINSPVKVITGYLKDITIDSKEEVNAILSLISNVGKIEDSTSNDKFVDLCKNMVVICNIVERELNKLTDKEKASVYTFISQVYEMVTKSYNGDDFVAVIKKMGKEIPSTLGDEDYNEYIKELTKIFDKTNTIYLEADGELFINQNATKKEVLEEIASWAVVKTYQQNSDGKYELQEVTLSIDNIGSFDTSTPGINTLTLTIDGKIKVISYYVIPNEHHYILDPTDVDTLENVLVYDVSGNVYYSEYYSLRVHIIDTVTGYTTNVTVPCDKISIPNPDYTTIGLKTGIARIDFGTYGIYYLPINYYVIDPINKVITEQNLNLYKEVFVGVNEYFSGSLNIYYNYGITVNTINGRRLWTYGNTAYYSINNSNIKGLDLNKVGNQKVKIVVDGQTFESEIFVHPLEDAVRLIEITFQMESNYLGNEDFKDQLYISTRALLDNYDIFNLKYSEVLKLIEEYQLPYEISFEPLETVQIGYVKFRLTIKDTQSNEIFTCDKDVKIVPKENYFKLSSFEVRFDNYNVLITNETDDDIFKMVRGVYLSGNYINENLTGIEAYEWLKQNVKLTRDEENGKLIFVYGNLESKWGNVYFGITKTNSSILFYSDVSWVPNFIKEFSCEDIINGLVQYVTLNNYMDFSNTKCNIYQIFKNYLGVEITDDTLNIQLNGETIRSYELYESDQYMLDFIFMLEENRTYNINDCIGSIKSNASFISFGATSSNERSELVFFPSVITDSVMSHISIERAPITVGRGTLIVSFKNMKVTDNVMWYSDETAKDISDIDINSFVALYKENKSANDFIKYLQYLKITYKDGTSKILSEEEYTSFLTEECTIMFNDDRVLITHRASGIQKTITNFHWFDIDSVVLNDETSLEVSYSDGTGLNPKGYRYSLYLVISDKNNGISYFDLTGNNAKNIAITLLKYRIISIFEFKSFAYEVNGNIITKYINYTY